MSINFLFILSFLLIESSQSLDEDYFKVPVKPEHYNITILVLFNESTFEGFVDILTECKEETNSIKLHAQEMVIDKDKITVKEVEASIPVPLSGVEIDEKNQTVVMSLGENLKKDVKYVIHIEYKANLTQSPYGFYKNWYMNADHTYGTLANTHFEPTWARKAFPCFDLPHMKATFQLTMGHDEKLFALNNMPLLSSEPVEGREGYVWEHFDKTLTMSTYLVAFAILDHGMKNITSGKITFWYPPLSNIPHEYALKKSVEMLSYLEDYFEMKYELPKLDFLVVNSYPTFAGACENWGLIIAEEKAVQEDQVLQIVAHELVHMWIGNVITMKCFSEVWLKEGITNYHDSILTDKFEETTSRDSDIADEFTRIMGQTDIGPLSLEHCPTDESTILKAYGKDTYFKGSLFTRMIQMTLGLTNMKKPIQLLLNKFKFQNFDEDDLWEVLKETTPPENFPNHLSFHEVFRSWTKQKGYPIVEVTRDYTSGTATLQQRIFHSEEPDKDAGICWWIPITYKTKCEKNSKNTVAEIWMTCPKQPLVIKELKSSEWILVNLQTMGMFIVKYDDANWNLITKTLSDKSRLEDIPSLDRFKLILDANQLTQFGLLSHESLLTTLLYLQHETNALVWSIALEYFNHLDWLSKDITVLKDDYMKTLVQTHFSEEMFQLGGLSEKEQDFREHIVKTACNSGIVKCIDEALRLFNEFVNSSQTITLKDRPTRRLVFCLANRHGPEENSMILMDLYDKYSGGDVGNDALWSLHCREQKPDTAARRMFSKNSRKIIELFTTRKMKINQVSSIIQDIEPVLREIDGPKIFVDGILEMSDRIHEKEMLNHLESLFENKMFLIDKWKTNRILKRIRSNIEWKKKYSEEIKLALLKITGRKNQSEESSTKLIPARSSKPVETRRMSSRSSKLFGRNCYWSALCLVFFTLFECAEENWGLIIAEETAVHSKKAVLGTIAHELVHMWIGNLMTMKCFGELWLKEGLTTYYTNILKDEFYEEQIGDSVIADDFITLMAQFSTTALSLEYCPDDKDVLMDMYGQNTYHRGALFTRMFQKFLGINDLKKTMQVLLKKFTYKNYDEDDLGAALKETSKSENFPEQADIHEVFSSWTKQVGYPLVEVNRNYDTGSAKLQQRRFYSRDEDSCWWIPVSYTTKSEKNHDHTAAKTWLKCPKEPLVISDLKPSEWILINLQSAGMFIVKYDDTNWNLITDTLTNDEIFEVIPFWDRFKLVLDASYLSHFGLLSHESVLTTLLFLKHETNAEVWRAALTYLSKLNWLSNDIIELKNEYMRILVQRHFSTKIFDFECLSKKEQNFNELIIKTACESGVQVCTEEVFRLFDEFKTSFPNVTLHEDLRALVFCLAVKYGPEENTKFILNLLKSVDLGMDLLPDLQASFLCLKNEPRIGKSTGSIFRNDTNQIFELLKAESLAIDPVDSIIQELENILQDRYATAVFVDSILLLSSQIHEPKILNRLKGLFEEEKFRVFKQKTDMIVERINSNVEWKTNYSEEIKMALLKILRSKNHTEETTTTRVPGQTDKPVRKPPSSCELFDANYYFTALCFVIVIFFDDTIMTKFCNICIGACENWGLIIAEKGSMGKKRILYIIAHELVHMWIGNLITMKCFAELWLKEGINNYFTSMLREKYGSERRDSIIAEEIENTIDQKFSYPISLDYCPTNIFHTMQMYTDGTYEKGNLLTRMIQMSLGMRDFKKTIKYLLNKFKYQNFDEEDLWVALKETTPPEDFPKDLDISTVFSSWTKQKRYPIVEVTRDYIKGTATLEQRTFSHNKIEEKDEGCWWIPISYTTNCEKKFKNTVPKIWMKCPREPLVIDQLRSSDWILINLQSTSMFIVKYDETNWELITETLNDESLFEMLPFWDRYKLILDAGHLAYNGLLSHSSMLTTLLYLKHETNPEVWKAAVAYLEKLDWLSWSIVGLKEEYTRILLQPYFSEELFEFEGLSRKKQHFREIIIRLACDSGILGCMDVVLELFKEFKDSFPNLTLNEDIRALVFCLAVKNGPEENGQYLSSLLDQDVSKDLIEDLRVGLLCKPSTKTEFPKSVRRIFRNDTRELLDLLKTKMMLIDSIPSVIRDIEPVLEEPDGSGVFVQQILEISDQLHETQSLDHLKQVFQNEMFQDHKEKTNLILERIASNIEWKKKYSQEIKLALFKILPKKADIREISTTRLPVRISTPSRKRTHSKSCKLFDKNYYYFGSLYFVLVILFE
ncbi:uncharacterized protein LOC123307169 [Coccinella septempunctata]|uniref:uncharacterized protein LOC123307169 n=1 Tax=Coccinella septempunctata TaxID=41139 RepID=UPI001D0747CA|nr:uncharacterized protein LOC123307169 [Coccinella septempunctata]